MRHKIFWIVLLATLWAVACSAPVADEPVDRPVVLDTDKLEVAEVSAENTPTPPPATNTPQPAEEATDIPTPTDTPDATATPFVSNLPVLGKAPDIRNETWLNSEPMTLSDNLGKVVLVEFWTYT